MARHEGAPLHLQSVRIRNVRCFETLNLNLKSSHGPRMWGVVLGDNGVGKTTLLRCIAMGLCDAASASGLLREIYGEWNRKANGEAKRSEIHLEFYSEGRESPARISTYITPSRSGYSQVHQETAFGRSRAEFPWDRIFACGYGAARRAFGTKDIEDYPTIDAVYTLFNYDTPLQNPELVLRRILSRSRKKRGSPRLDLNDGRLSKLEPLLESICSVLMLPPGSIQLTVRGLSISGPWGPFQPVGGLGDGFQATLSWLTDLLGWAVLYDPAQPVELVKGIVLVDELEQHLHPRWQRKIIKLLREQFPFVQFIATTHTPMCAIGTTDLKDEECKLIKLEREDDSVVAVEDFMPPRHQRADQVLTSSLFDLPTTRDDESLSDINRYNQLKTSKSLTGPEKKERALLFAKLKKQFSSAESTLETTVRRAVSKSLGEQKDKNVDRIAADFEVMRQLRLMASK
jgi:hypothetical protein